MTSGYGTAAYVVGWNSDELAVWRTTDGSQWKQTNLDVAGLAYHTHLDLGVDIAAGPRGVIVVGYDTVSPFGFHGFYVWRSADLGLTFGRPVRVPLPGEESSPSLTVGPVQATTNGFLVGIVDGTKPGILSSSDGHQWAAMPAGGALADTYLANPIAGNSSTTVAFNWNAQSQQPAAVYLRNGTWSPAIVGPGRLPDDGVVPISQRVVEAVCNWGPGFIAIGNINANTPTPEFSGMVWWSADGSSWIRQPVQANGFDAVAQFMGAAVSNGKILLIATPVKGSDFLMWQSSPEDEHRWSHVTTTVAGTSAVQ
jgi:hypothetical protein